MPRSIDAAAEPAACSSQERATVPFSCTTSGRIGAYPNSRHAIERRSGSSHCRGRRPVAGSRTMQTTSGLRDAKRAIQPAYSLHRQSHRGDRDSRDRAQRTARLVGLERDKLSNGRGERLVRRDAPSEREIAARDGDADFARLLAGHDRSALAPHVDAAQPLDFPVRRRDRGRPRQAPRARRPPTPAAREWVSSSSVAVTTSGFATSCSNQRKSQFETTFTTKTRRSRSLIHACPEKPTFMSFVTS